MLTEKALKAFALSVQEGDLDIIQPNHLIEFYSLSQIQIFRSLQYFELFSYTLEDICCRKWHHLYQRSPEDHAAILKTVCDFLNLPVKKAIRTNLSEHKIRERDSLEHLTLYNQTQWLIPLHQHREVAAVMFVQLPRAAEIN